MNDYNNFVLAANNKIPPRMPLYDHIVSTKVMEEILNREFSYLASGDDKDKIEFFKNYCEFFDDMGYDAFPYEYIISSILPNSGALYKQTPGVIKNMDDFLKYPWEEARINFKKNAYPLFDALRVAMPKHLKAVGGPGNGIFECVQDIVGFENLCLIKYDDEELFSLLFEKMGKIMLEIWTDFMKNYEDLYCVCRFGDDLGFFSNTLLPREDIIDNIIPKYKPIIDLVHSYNKPFLLHSCGRIFDVMPNIIDLGINAKHSNEDKIAPFSKWVDEYGKQIALFGGIDTDNLCVLDEKQIKELVKETCEYAYPRCGFALGSGNSITDYVPASGYLAMNESARRFRKEIK